LKLLGRQCLKKLVLRLGEIEPIQSLVTPQRRRLPIIAGKHRHSQLR
jgi:hypothetical protein